MSVKARSLIGMVSLAAVIILVIVPLPPPDSAVAERLLPPSGDHPFGTDQFGRSVLVRTLWAARAGITAAAVTTVAAGLLGMLIGTLSALANRWADQLAARLTDALLAVPGLLVALVVVALLPESAVQVVLAVSLGLFPLMIRYTRAVVLPLRSADYVTVARAGGAGWLRILIVHILPNAGPLLLSYLATIFAWALVNITALEFLGVVGSPADALWGRLLRDGRLYLVEAPWVALAPTLALILVVSVAAFLSESKNARP